MFWTVSEECQKLLDNITPKNWQKIANDGYIYSNNSKIKVDDQDHIVIKGISFNDYFSGKEKRLISKKARELYYFLQKKEQEEDLKDLFVRLCAKFKDLTYLNTEDLTFNILRSINSNHWFLGKDYSTIYLHNDPNSRIRFGWFDDVIYIDGRYCNFIFTNKDRKMICKKANELYFVLKKRLLYNI